MPSYNFQKRFAHLVETGAKTQTIRAKGKRPAPCVGQIAYCFTGQRTKHCRPLGAWQIVRVVRVEILFIGLYYDGVELTDAEKETEARKDGFEDFCAFYKFFGEPFDGWLIEWKWRPPSPQLPLF